MNQVRYNGIKVTARYVLGLSSPYKGRGLITGIWLVDIWVWTPGASPPAWDGSFRISSPIQPTVHTTIPSAPGAPKLPKIKPFMHQNHPNLCHIKRNPYQPTHKGMALKIYSSVNYEFLQKHVRCQPLALLIIFSGISYPSDMCQLGLA